MSLGVLMQAAQAFQRVTSALSWPVDNLGEIARCRASAARVLSLYNDVLALAAGPEDGRVTVTRGEHPCLVLESVCLTEPAGTPVAGPISAEIHRGERVLVTGDPAATTALFRAIGGLWPWGSGRVRLPRDQAIAFMPQRPLLPEGTLREALTYPDPPESFTTPAMQQALECAGVAWLAPRLDETAAWDQVLPLRARQRLGFARVLLQRPAWIIMQEASDAFDARGERVVLDMLRHELPDTTLVTISFHPGLEALHQRTLVVRRAGQPDH
jgi:putative ATP-binding cassette transporter